MKPLSLAEFQKLRDSHLVIDLRKPEEFAEGFIAESVSLAFDENFVKSLEAIAEDEQAFLLVADEKDIERISEVLKTEGVSNVTGYLQGGISSLSLPGQDENQIDMLITIEADEFAM